MRFDQKQSMKSMRILSLWDKSRNSILVFHRKILKTMIEFTILSFHEPLKIFVIHPNKIIYDMIFISKIEENNEAFLRHMRVWVLRTTRLIRDLLMCQMTDVPIGRFGYWKMYPFENLPLRALLIWQCANWGVVQIF